MIFRDDLKVKADDSDIWPPAVEHPAGSVPAISPDVEQRELRIGRIALLSAAAGIGVPALAMGILMLLPSSITSGVNDAPLSVAGLMACLLGVVCEVTAVVTGVMARRTRAGRWGLAIPLFVLAVSVVLVLIQHHMNGTWPWQGFGDDCGCDGSG